MSINPIEDVRSDTLKPSQVLERAAELLTPRGRWTQGAASRDAEGNEDDDVNLLPNAVCWCAWGAMLHVSGERYIGTKGVPGEAFNYLERHLGVSRIPDWNDAASRRKGQVVQALRDAAALARAEGQ